MVVRISLPRERDYRLPGNLAHWNLSLPRETMFFVSGHPERVDPQLLNGQSLKILRRNITEQGDVQAARAKCAKHVLRRHHAKINAHPRIRPLECPEDARKELSSRRDQVAHADF